MPGNAGRADGTRSFASFFFAYFGYVGLMMPFISLWLSAQGMSALQLATLMSTFQISRIFGPFLWGWLSNHLDNRAGLLQASALLAVLGFVPIYWLEGFYPLLFWLLLLNTVTAGIVPLGDAMVVQALKARPGGFDVHYGRVRAFGSLGFIALTLCVGAWFDAHGIDTLPTVGLLSLIAVFVSTLWFHDAPHTHDGPQCSLREQLWRPEVRWFLLSVFLMIFAHAALYVFYSLHLERLGYDKTRIGLMWTLGVVIEIVYFNAQGRVMRRFSPQTLIAWCGLAACLRFLLIGHADHVLWLIVAQALHALSFAAHHSASIKQIQLWFPGRLQAQGQALYTSVTYGLGGTLGGLLMGWIWQHGGAVRVFDGAALAALLSTLAIWQGMRVARH